MVALSTPLAGLKAQRFVHKFKDKEGKDVQRFSNKIGRYLIVTEIIVRKVHNENNKMEIILVFPECDNLEVIEKPKASKEKK